MNMFPHTVTIYNSSIVLGDKLEETAVNNITIIRGVLVAATKAVNVAQTGLTNADDVTLYIPKTAQAVDGRTGKPKTYIGPMEFWMMEDNSEHWTLSTSGRGGTTFFVKGEFVTENEDVALSQDGAYSVTKVDDHDYGGDMALWQVGGA